MTATSFAPTFFHGTKVDLPVGGLLSPGYASNFGQRKMARWIYFAATLDAAVWGAELALGEGPDRIYVVEATGPYEDDPNLTDKKFQGNPTRSYRSADPVRILGEVTGWQGHAPDRLQAMRQAVARAASEGIEAIED